MRIEELHLKNFRCFKELDIVFPKSNLAVFIGLNGAGKSAVLDAITLLMNDYLGLNDKYLVLNSDDILFREDFSELSFCVNGLSFCNHWKITLHKKNCTTEKNEEYRDFFNSFFYIHYTTDRKITYSIFEEKNGYFNIDKFDEWFERQENIENELKREKEELTYTNPILNVVRKAIESFFSYISEVEFKNLRVKRSDSGSSLVINKNGKPLKFSQLSSGQVLLLHLIGDISLKLALEYTKFDYEIADCELVLKSKGIILIDEIELHLHPQWQREVLPALQKTFPNIQFIVTTHSPQVLSRVHKDDIFILKDNQLYQPSSNPIGRDSSDILAEIMEVTKRPKEIQELSDNYFSLLNRKLFEEAQTIRNQLLDKLDSKDPIFIRADAMITRMQLLKK